MYCLVILFAIQDGTENNACFRERIVRQQSFIGQEVEDVLFTKLLQHTEQSCFFAFQVFDFFIIRAVFWLCLQLLNHAFQCFHTGTQCILLLFQIFKSIQNLHIHRTIARTFATHKVLQFISGTLVKVCGKHLHERVQLSCLCTLHIIKEIERKHIRRALVQFVQDHANFVRDCTIRNPFFYPRIKAEGDKLPFQHSGGTKEDFWRCYITGNHIQRVSIEIEVMWSCVCHRQCQGIAILTAGTTGSLQELALCRRHTAKDNRRKIANINTHFKRRGTGKYIRVPNLLGIFLTLKVDFKLFTVRTLQQTGVFSCIDTSKVTGTV